MIWRGCSLVAVDCKQYTQKLWFEKNVLRPRCCARCPLTVFGIIFPATHPKCRQPEKTTQSPESVYFGGLDYHHKSCVDLSFLLFRVYVVFPTAKTEQGNEPRKEIAGDSQALASKAEGAAGLETLQGLAARQQQQRQQQQAGRGVAQELRQHGVDVAVVGGTERRPVSATITPAQFPHRTPT